MEDGEWDVMKMVDITRFGDVIGSVWQIGVEGRADLQAFHDPTTAIFEQTIGGRLTEMGFIAMGDEREAR